MKALHLFNHILSRLVVSRIGVNGLADVQAIEALHARECDIHPTLLVVCIGEPIRSRPRCNRHAIQGLPLDRVAGEGVRRHTWEVADANSLVGHRAVRMKPQQRKLTVAQLRERAHLLPSVAVVPQNQLRHITRLDGMHPTTHCARRIRQEADFGRIEDHINHMCSRPIRHTH